MSWRYGTHLGASEAFCWVDFFRWQVTSAIHRRRVLEEIRRLGAGHDASRALVHRGDGAPQGAQNPMCLHPCK